MALLCALLFLQLGGGVLGAVLNLDLGRDWKLITDDFTEIKFPLDDWILEIKTLDNIRDSGFAINLTENEITKFKEDQEDAMTMHIFSNGLPVANFFWSRKGNEEENDAYDVRVRYCAQDAANYISDVVCSGREVQEWAWNLERAQKVTLSCYDKVEYVYDITQQSWCPWTTDVIDRVTLLHMKGYYLRAIAKRDGGEMVFATTDPPFTFPTAAVTEEDDTLPKPTPAMRKTCDCWTRECSFCEDAKCRVGYDVTGKDSKGITVISKVGYKTVNTVFLFGSGGEKIGAFQFNRRGIFLEGCIKCPTPRPLPSANIAGKQNFYDWNIQFNNGVIRLTIHGSEVFEQELVGECAERYSDIQEFAFTEIGCDGNFLVHDPSNVGSHFTVNDRCGTECVVEE